MKKSLPYEIVAAILVLFGAFLLVGVYTPLLDPGPKSATPSLGYYIVMIPFPVLVLIASWHFNKKARASIQQSEMAMCVPETGWQRILKWILGAVVIIWVLIAFLWCVSV